MKILATDWDRVEALNFVSKSHYLKIGDIVSYDLNTTKFGLDEFKNEFEKYYIFSKVTGSMYVNFEVTGFQPYPN